MGINRHQDNLVLQVLNNECIYGDGQTFDLQNFVGRMCKRLSAQTIGYRHKTQEDTVVFPVCKDQEQHTGTDDLYNYW